LKAVTLAVLISCGLAASAAQAGYVVALVQQGSDVVASGSGELDLTGLSYQVTGFIGPVMFPDEGVILMGSGRGGLIDGYSGFTGPTSFGTGGFAGSDGFGDIVGINGGHNLLYVPHGYVSSTFLDSFNVYGFHATFKELGVTPGIYEWTWGTGANQNFTLKIGAAAVSDSPVGLPAFAMVLMLLSAAKLRELRRSPSPALSPKANAGRLGLQQICGSI